MYGFGDNMTFSVSKKEHKTEFHLTHGSKSVKSLDIKSAKFVNKDTSWH